MPGMTSDAALTLSRSQVKQDLPFIPLACGRGAGGEGKRTPQPANRRNSIRKPYLKRFCIPLYKSDESFPFFGKGSAVLFRQSCERLDRERCRAFLLLNLPRAANESIYE